MKNWIICGLCLVAAIFFLSCDKEEHMQMEDVPTDSLVLSEYQNINSGEPCFFRIQEDLHLYLDGTMPGAMAYHWFPSNETEPVVAFIPNSYHLSSFVGLYGFLGCYDLTVTYVDTTITYTVVVQLMEYAIYCPNVFSPNGDGINDLWCPFFSTYVSLTELKIYDQEFNRVFNAQEGDSYAWDGEWNHHPCEEGYYYYFVHYKTQEGTTVSSQGMLNLIR